jgi:hypothetical protein
MNVNSFKPEFMKSNFNREFMNSGLKPKIKK